jgi:SAM-dependent methyltransferase
MRKRPDSKDAEKAYLARTGGSAWEREKPFSPPGDDTLDDSVELLHDFAVALRLLQPSIDDRIADLGAGGGWCSDLLQRLNRKSVAIDIAVDMLRVCRQRGTRGAIPAVAGDFERLPFVDGAFDKALCLSALHHVPDMAAAVREIARVLTPDGVAVFSEPGLGHADKPASVAATSDFGVLEQEVLIEPFIGMCRAAGFVDVRVCPMAYVFPDFELSLEDWRRWKRLPRTKRPLRAAEKMWRALLELVGAGKQSVLFEEAFAMRLVRLLQQPVEEHPFFVAAKTPRSRDRGAPYRATIAIVSLPEHVAPGSPMSAIVRVTNTGATTWRARAGAGAQIRVGVQLLDASSRMLGRDFARADLDEDVQPKQSRTITVRFNAPGETGNYRLKVDLVAEGATWFEPTGSAVATRRLTVQRSASA